MFVDLMITKATDADEMATADKATDDVPAAACSDLTHVVYDDMALIALAATMMCLPLLVLIYHLSFLMI